MKAVRIHEHGDLNVIKWEDIDTPIPGPNKVLIDMLLQSGNMEEYLRMFMLLVI